MLPTHAASDRQAQPSLLCPSNFRRHLNRGVFAAAGPLLRAERPRPRQHAGWNDRQQADRNAGQRSRRATTSSISCGCTGYDVRVQDADARRAPIGLTARVSNIIAIRPGRRSEAIGLLSHYDSVPAGPGAADDGLGVAVSLEAARVLAARADRQLDGDGPHHRWRRSRLDLALPRS